MLNYHWVKTKHHRLWFLTKTCSCYSTKILKVVFVEHHKPFNVYVYHRSQIQFEDEDHAVNMSLLRNTTCDHLFVPSDYKLNVDMVQSLGLLAPKDYVFAGHDHSKLSLNEEAEN